MESLAVIGDFIGRCMEELGLDSREILRVQMAVDEACTNIIEYGGADLDIWITCSKKGDDAIVAIEDRGEPFDPLSVEPPDLDVGLEQRKVGGLGIYFMKSLMDEIGYEFRDGKNVLTMVKRVRIPSPETVEMD